MPSSAKFTPKDLTELSILLAFAIILRLIENLFPPLFALPGARLGLANIMTIIVLVKYGTEKAGLFLLARISLVGFFSTGIGSSGFFIGLSGAALSFVFMALAKDSNWLSPIGLGLLGAFMHNLGQIIMSMHLLENQVVLDYFPYLVMIGIPCGFFTGICAKIILRRI